MDFTQIIAKIQDFRQRYPGASGIFIENRANGAAAINTLSQQVPGINKVSPSKSKYDRAFASSDELNAGNWYLPHRNWRRGWMHSYSSIAAARRSESSPSAANSSGFTPNKRIKTGCSRRDAKSAVYTHGELTPLFASYHELS